eukprot:gene12230-5816_t
MDFNDLLKVKKKKENGEKLTLEEKLFLSWHRITDYPKQRGNVTLFKSEEQLNEILLKGKPVFVAYLIPKPYDYPTYLKRRLRTLAPYFKEDAEFVEVDCSLHANFCSTNAFAGVPSMDVFYLSKKQQRISDSKKPKRYRFDYLLSFCSKKKYF